MALTTGQIKYIQDLAIAAEAQLGQYGPLVVEDVLWAGTPGYNADITDPEIVAVPAFADAGLTHQQLADAQAALSAIKTAITNALPALSVLSKLA